MIYLKKIIDFTLEQMLKNDELGTVEMLRGVIAGIIKEFGDITDITKEKYNERDGEYEIKISISTIRNYLKPYKYVVKKDIQECIVREMSFQEYAEIKKKLDKNDENNGDKTMETINNNLTAKQRLALDFVKMADLYKQQDSISIRCATSVKIRLEAIYARYSIFPKQYIISHLLNIGLTELEKNDEKINDR